MKKSKEIEKLLKEIAFTNFKRMYPELKKLGIHPGQEFFLCCIIENNGLNQRELAECSKRESATITKTIQRLEHSGYIMRKADEQDRRMYHIYITEKGRKIYAEVQKLKQQQNKLFSKILTEEEKLQFYKILCKVKKGLEEGAENNEKNI